MVPGSSFPLLYLSSYLSYSSKWDLQGSLDLLSLVKVGIQGPFSYWSKWGFQGSLDLLSLSYSSNWGRQGSLELLFLSYSSS